MNEQKSKSPKTRKNMMVLAIILSFIIHGFFVLGTYLYPRLNPSLEDTTIEISLNENSLEYLKDTEDPKRLVEFDTNKTNQTADPKAKYLAAKNNTVQKETIARLDTQFKNLEKTKPTAAQKEKAQEENPWEKKPDKSTEAKLFNNGFDVYEKVNQKDQARQKRTSASAQAKDTSSATDRLEGVDQSLMTQLNTKEYMYYGYYTRIRQQLNQWWQPKVKEKVTKLMSQGRTIASEQNKNTKLIIVLDNEGQLVTVQVLGASGVRELDDAAVEAFRKAAPFPNPPKGIVDLDGTIKIRWDFIVES